MHGHKQIKAEVLRAGRPATSATAPRRSGAGDPHGRRHFDVYQPEIADCPQGLRSTACRARTSEEIPPNVSRRSAPCRGSAPARSLTSWPSAPGTVENYRRRIMRKLALTSNAA
jgi:hypothetical protein